VLSLIPFLVVTAAATALVSPISVTSKFEKILGAVLPMESDAEREIIVNAVSQTSSRGLATFGFLLAVYTSFNFMMQIVKTLQFIFDHQRSSKPSGLMDFVKSIVLLLLWICFLTVICMSFVVIPVIRATIDSLTIVKDLKGLPQVLPPTHIDIYGIASDLVVFMTLFAAFFLSYTLIANQKYPLRVLLQASAFATIGWFGCSILYFFVLQRVWSSNAIYGALGSLIAILLWGQTCAWTVIGGGCLIVRFSPPPKRMRASSAASA
jgi:uncharacterized BrkB/YihY/UPF0761 family membrane protein